MSFNIHFADQGLGLILKRTVGTDSTNDFANALVAFFRGHKERLSAIRYVYIDYTEAYKLKVSMEDILRFVDIAKIIASDNKALVVAICAPQFENYCMTKMWEVHLPEDTGWLTMAFRDKEKTQAWLKKTVRENLTFV